jgi:hypothetical protein
MAINRKQAIGFIIKVTSYVCIYLGCRFVRIRAYSAIISSYCILHVHIFG